MQVRTKARPFIVLWKKRKNDSIITTETVRPLSSIPFGSLGGKHIMFSLLLNIDTLSFIMERQYVGLKSLVNCSL